MENKLKIIFLSVLMILFGSFQALFVKLLYQSKSEGIDGKEKYFSKPWFIIWMVVLILS
jgi:hypothetical protein